MHLREVLETHPITKVTKGHVTLQSVAKPRQSRLATIPVLTESPTPKNPVAIHLTLPEFFRRSRDLQPAGGWGRPLPGLR
jgi:hypothetical protein